MTDATPAPDAADHPEPEPTPDAAPDLAEPGAETTAPVEPAPAAEVEASVEAGSSEARSSEGGVSEGGVSEADASAEVEGDAAALEAPPTVDVVVEPAEESAVEAEAPPTVESILRERREAEQQLLDELWNRTAPETAEIRFRDAADDAAHSGHVRSVLATQLARALGLQSKFDEGEAVLEAVVAEPTGTGSRAIVREHPAVEGDAALVDAVARSEAAALRARVALERGRLLASAGHPDEAVPVFTLAAREAATAGSVFLALDALHMLALADVGHEEEWAAEALDVLDGVREPRTRRWAVAVNNNVGWHLHDIGRADEALGRFEAAARAADAFGTSEQRQLARWAIARCLRTLGRHAEALDIQHALARTRPGDQWVHTEIALLEQALDAPGETPAAETPDAERPMGSAPDVPGETAPPADAVSVGAASAPVSEGAPTIEA